MSFSASPASSASRAEHAPRAPLWRRALPWVFLGAIVVLGATRVRPAAVLAHLRGVRLLEFLAFAACAHLLVLFLDVVTSAATYRAAGAPISVRRLFIVRGASQLPSLLNAHVGQAYVTYLLCHLAGAPRARVLGGTLLLYATTFGALVVLATPSLWLEGTAVAAPILTVLLVAGGLYLLLLGARPSRIHKLPVLDVLFDVGVSGHLRLLLGRVLHVGTICGATYVAYRFFRIDPPLARSFVVFPALALVTSLPITPQGAGVRELLVVAALVPGATSEDTERMVAAGVAITSFNVVAHIALGLVCAPFAARALPRSVAASSGS